jgi:hypothetical protein
MFPGRKVGQLFQTHEGGIGFIPEPPPPQDRTPTIRPIRQPQNLADSRMAPADLGPATNNTDKDRTDGVQATIITIWPKRASVHGTMYESTLDSTRPSCTPESSSCTRRHGDYRRRPCSPNSLGHPIHLLPLRRQTFPSYSSAIAISAHLPCSKTVLATDCLMQH